MGAEGYDIGAHIEHVEPKSLIPSKTFDYTNLVLSAMSSDDLSLWGKENRFGGHAKGNEYDASLFVSPLDVDCAHYFVYLSETGEVEPSPTLSQHDNEKAVYTINLLNLNAAYLTNKRRNWLKELHDEIDKILDDVTALENLAACELGLTNHRLRRFHSAVRQAFGKIGEATKLI